ncbi:MAG: outer membrane beta-barrel protein, partial [Myxococcota bacterium]
MSARGLCLGLTLIVGIGISASSQAQEEDYGRSGPYLGLGMGFGWEQFDDSGSLNYDNALGLEGWAGYRLSAYLAAEVQLEYLDRFNTSRMGSKIDSSALTFTGNLKAYLMTGPVQPFAVVGLGFLNFKEGASKSDTGSAIRFGGGVDLYDSPNVSFGATLSYVLALGAV